MKTNKKNNLYEAFHSRTKKINQIPSRQNFTYKPFISLLDGYLRKKSSILDIGCGTGAVDFYLASSDHSIDGIDVSTRAISACKRDSRLLGFDSKLRFKVNSLETISKKKKYDAIILFEVIEHIKDDKRAIKKIISLLKNSGLLFISTPSISAPLYKLGLLREFDDRVGHLRRYSLESISLLVESAGFKIIDKKVHEGILRNWLFTGGLLADFSLRAVNKVWFVSLIIENIDFLLTKIFGASDYILVAKKP